MLAASASASSGWAANNSMKTRKTTPAQPVDLSRLVRRWFVVQERYCCHDQEDQWADDPDILESATREDAIERLKADNARTRGHAETWHHRIIERTDSVVWTTPNDSSSQTRREGASPTQKGNE